MSQSILRRAASTLPQALLDYFRPGNLTGVTEPDTLGGMLYTSYTYDWMNHLIGSSMTRGSTTQTRTFVYNSAGQLTSATNPESGTVSYAYNTDTTLAQKTDAKGQVTVYTYDSSKRVTETQIYPYGLSYAEDVCQRVTYGYDAGAYGLGRLTSTAYGMPYTTYTGGSGGCPGTAAWHSYQESYTYDPAGGVTNKTLTVYTPDSTYFTYAASIGIDYSYDSAGRISTAAYPRTTNYYYSTPPTYTYSYDGMGRMAGMTDNVINPVTGLGTPWTQNGQYDAGGRMTSLQLFDGLSWPAGYPTFVTDARTFNTNGQLTSMWSGGLTYSYSPTSNNGQITTMTDSGGTVSYTYDALKRLTGATDVSGGSTVWTQAFGYDGFGNMTSKTLNGGANMAPAVDPTTNRLTSGYDANGNMLSGYGLTATYDERNRLASATPTSGGTEYYGYAPDNKRIYRWNPTTGVEEWTFYGAKGERIGTFAWATPGSPTYGLVPTTSNVWFGGRLIDKVDTSGYLRLVVRDRVGSDRESGAKYYPYGDEITSTANDTEKYATYVRDSFTALDYADQRYYASAYGRFNTVDSGAVHLKNPGGWNRYAYVGGDPINRIDPRGLDELSVNGLDFGGEDQGPIFYATGLGFSGYSNCVFDPEDCSPWGTGAEGTGAEGGGGGGKIGTFLIAESNAQQALSNFEDTNFSPNCAQFLDNAFNSNGVLEMLQQEASNVSLYDASTINTAVGPTLFPGNTALALTFQQTANDVVGVNVGATLAQYFAASPNVYAAGEYNGSAIFYSTSAFASTLGSGMAMYTMFHEMLHVAGLGGDTQIEQVFGISPASVASEGTMSITYKLAAECGQ